MPNPQYGNSYMWGTCPHVTRASSTLVPATLNPATCQITQQAQLVPAVNNGYVVNYLDPLFGTVKGQDFDENGKPSA